MFWYLAGVNLYSPVIMTYLSYKSQWARRLVRKALARDLNALAGRYPVGELAGLLRLEELHQTVFDPYDLPKKPLEYAAAHCNIGTGITVSQTIPVCIIGGGIAGLYIAMLLDSLEIPGLSYDILEASNCLGGRIRTHHFSADMYDYFDIGAMRYPKIPLMRRAFHLFTLTGIPLIQYHLEGSKCPQLYNEILDDSGEARQSDVFKLSHSNGGLVPDRMVEKGADGILAETFEPYRSLLANDFEAGFRLLMELDGLSTREFLRKIGFDYHTIQWLETMTSATSLFDQSFAEAVIDSLDFDYPSESVEWSCIEGGSSLLIDAMASRLKKKPEIRKRVTSIAIDRDKRYNANMIVNIDGEKTPREYVTVFCTTSLASLQRVDLSGADLHIAQKEAIRSLHYDSSAKVAIRFTHPWWISKCGIKSGGTAVTDLPLRVCIYPSYGIYADPSKPAILLCSYTWAQDALRIGSLIRDSSPNGEEELVELMLRDLARMHANHISYDEIKMSYTDHYAYEWGRDPYASGAFAFFGPGQFSSLYPYLTRPAADSKLHIVGEAASAHHAWIIGSLDSAYRAVHNFLERFELWEYMNTLREKWGALGELEVGESGTAHLQVALGMQTYK
ncbi:hypothetical protein F5884DRAFT_722331 [Xylogone sp. PMI_703]|nr:hypothetical protein F5884DRAFT_722331 [Xylogone sp. PMI_703]